MKAESSIVFVDVDGTLVHAMKNEYIPPSAVDAIRKARQNGHRVFLCTGRSKAEIFPPIYAIGLDGVIGAAGGFVELGDKVIFHRTLTPEAATKITDFLDRRRIDYYLECNDGLFASKHLLPHLYDVFYAALSPEEREKAMEEGGSHFINSMRPMAECSLESINKISFLETAGSTYREVEEQFGKEFYMVRCTVPDFGEESGEISLPGINKYTAIQFLLDYLNADGVRTLAIGDGMNDVEMFRAVDVKIAMGNAKPGLKELADYVTTDILDDGIYHAFEHFGLLD